MGHILCCMNKNKNNLDNIMKIRNEVDMIFVSEMLNNPLVNDESSLKNNIHYTIKIE